MSKLIPISELHALVRLHRKKAGLNQNDLADLAGVGKTLIHDIEKDHTGVSLEKLLAVLKVLNIDLKLSPPNSEL